MEDSHAIDILLTRRLLPKNGTLLGNLSEELTAIWDEARLPSNSSVVIESDVSALLLLPLLLLLDNSMLSSTAAAAINLEAWAIRSLTSL